MAIRVRSFKKAIEEKAAPIIADFGVKEQKVGYTTACMCHPSALPAARLWAALWCESCRALLGAGELKLRAMNYELSSVPNHRSAVMKALILPI